MKYFLQGRTQVSALFRETISLFPKLGLGTVMIRPS